MTESSRWNLFGVTKRCTNLRSSPHKSGKRDVMPTACFQNDRNQQLEQFRKSVHMQSRFEKLVQIFIRQQPCPVCYRWPSSTLSRNRKESRSSSCYYQYARQEPIFQKNEPLGRSHQLPAVAWSIDQRIVGA